MVEWTWTSHSETPLSGLQYTLRWMPRSSSCSQKVSAASLGWCITYHPEVAATHVQGLAAEDREPTELVQVPVMSVQLKSTTSVLPHMQWGQSRHLHFASWTLPLPAAGQGWQEPQVDTWNRASGHTAGALRWWYCFCNAPGGFTCRVEEGRTIYRHSGQRKHLAWNLPLHQRPCRRTMSLYNSSPLGQPSNTGEKERR